MIMKTKTILLLSILFVGLSISSCNRSEIEENIEEFAKFTIKENTTYAITPDALGIPISSIPVGLLSIEVDASNDINDANSKQNIPVNFKKDLQDNNISAEDISRIDLTSIKLNLKDLGSKTQVVSNFNFINSIALFLLEDGDPTSKLKLGELNNIQNLNTSEISLDNLTTINFKSLINRNEFLVGAEITVNRVYRSSISVEASLEFLVTPCISVFEETQNKCEGQVL